MDCQKRGSILQGGGGEDCRCWLIILSTVAAGKVFLVVLWSDAGITVDVLTAFLTPRYKSCTEQRCTQAAPRGRGRLD